MTLKELSEKEIDIIAEYLRFRFRFRFKIDTKLEKSRTCSNVNSSDELMFVEQRDTKVVCVLSNCYSNQLTIVTKTQRDGKKVAVQCPGTIAFYGDIIGAVDLADQVQGLYELHRRSTK